MSLGLILVIVLGALFGLRGCRGGEIAFFDLRVVNDTHRTVKIQPCWDLDCLNTIGLPIAVLRPGDSKLEAGRWTNDPGAEIVVAVLRPGAAPTQFDGCLMKTIGLDETGGVVRVSQRRPCLHGPEGGGGG